MEEEVKQPEVKENLNKNPDKNLEQIAFSVPDEKTARLIKALDNYIIQVGNIHSSMFSMFPVDVRNSLLSMDGRITTFINRVFPDSEKRIKEYRNMITIFLKDGSQNYFMEHTSICSAMLIVLGNMRDELLIHGLDFKTNMAQEQKETMLQKIEETNRKSIEAGIPKVFQVKAEKEEKKRVI